MKLFRLCLLVFVLVAAWLGFRNFGSEWNETLVASNAEAKLDTGTVEKGRYLALLGNCTGCHTSPGELAYSGGYGIPTPFGTVHASNLTTNVEVGIGAWSANDFWRAMRHGRSKDGRLLSPAFPYTSYTRITRDDSDAIYAYLKTMAPSDKKTPASTLRFPFDTQAALMVWRALYFSVPKLQEKTQDRGEYLLHGLGHCDACHAPRDRLGGITGDGAERLTGGFISSLKWYAPSLLDLPTGTKVAEYLITGRSGYARASGPMAEVVFHSTQYWKLEDARALESTLDRYSQAPRRKLSVTSDRPAAKTEIGTKVYAEHCEQCHGKNGEGDGADGVIYPALKSNPVVLRQPIGNLVRIIVEGGFGPSTAAHPRPYGMQPYGHILSDLEIAGVLTHIRGSWGNQAPFVTEIEVKPFR